MAKMRCRSCRYFMWDFVTGERNVNEDEKPFCGLHGCEAIDPDGEQRDLDHRGGCGYVRLKDSEQLTLFDLFDEEDDDI